LWDYVNLSTCLSTYFFAIPIGQQKKGFVILNGYKHGSGVAAKVVKGTEKRKLFCPQSTLPTPKNFKLFLFSMPLTHSVPLPSSIFFIFISLLLDRFAFLLLE